LMPENPDGAIVEKKFTFEIDGEKINGRIDQINIIDKDTIEIIDYKSGSTHYSDRELKEELQLKLYRMAFDLSDDLKELRNKNMEMRYISLGNLKKPVSTLPGEYYDFDEIKKILTENIARIKNEKFSPEPGNYNSCLNCKFKVLCPNYYGRKD
jgi:RecB family exonuclease